MRFHLCATKRYLADAIRRLGAKEVLADWDGTDAEALAALEADPREHIAFDCDNFDPVTGKCKGHETTGKATSHV